MAKRSQLEEAYKNHARMVYGFLLAQTGDPDMAEELTQETFYQAVKSSGRFDESCKISTWLCAIAKNVLLAYRKKTARQSAPVCRYGAAAGLGNRFQRRRIRTGKNPPHGTDAAAPRLAGSHA